MLDPKKMYYVVGFPTAVEIGTDKLLLVAFLIAGADVGRIFHPISSPAELDLFKNK
jgi:hypothetical protein